MAMEKGKSLEFLQLVEGLTLMLAASAADYGEKRQKSKQRSKQAS